MKLVYTIFTTDTQAILLKYHLYLKMTFKGGLKGHALQSRYQGIQCFNSHLVSYNFHQLVSNFTPVCSNSPWHVFQKMLFFAAGAI